MIFKQKLHLLTDSPWFASPTLINSNIFQLFSSAETFSLFFCLLFNRTVPLHISVLPEVRHKCAMELEKQDANNREGADPDQRYLLNCELKQAELRIMNEMGGKNVNRPKLRSKFLKTRQNSELYNLAVMTTNSSDTVELIELHLCVHVMKQQCKPCHKWKRY